MNPLLIISLAAIALLAFNSKATAPGSNTGVSALRSDLINWGFTWAARATDAEVITLHKFLSFERVGDFVNADKWVKQAQAIARKYGETI